MKRYTLMLSILLAIVHVVVAQEGTRLTFSPERPVSGQPITLTYTPLPSMTGNQTIKGVAYTFENYAWHGHDIVVRNEGAVWRGTFTPSKDAGFVAFKFVADTITDNNNNQTFCTVLNKPDGTQAVGSYAAWGLLRSQSYGHDIPGYIDYSQVKEVSDTIVYYWLNNEVTRNRQTAVALAPMYIRAMKAAKINGVEGAEQRAVAYLLGIGTEEAMNNAFDILQYNDEKRADSVKTAILKKYPGGLLALRMRYTEKYDYRDPKATKEHFSSILRDFPPTPEREAYLNTFGKGYDEVYSSLMIMDWMENNTAAVDRYTDSLSFTGCNSVFYKLIDISHMRKDKTDAELLPIATKIVERMNKLKTCKPELMDYLSESEWTATAESIINSSVAETYSEILKNTGHTEEALRYSEKAQQAAQYKRAEINDNMAELLKATGRDNELKTLLEKSVYYNQVSTMQTDMLKALYVKEKGNAEGYEAYVESLKNPKEKSAIQKDVEGYRRTGKMPEWSLTDADGRMVSSESLKGKVYVIDFWANWCHPCKASLPGMKLAADHYKDDPNVQFLFIDTQEYIKDYQTKAKEYLKEQKLDLHLVFDGKAAGAKTNDLLSAKVMKQYTISGIPMKVVVDAGGNVRFIAVGYKGSPSALRDEMIEMVEQAKK